MWTAWLWLGFGGVFRKKKENDDERKKKYNEAHVHTHTHKRSPPPPLNVANGERARGEKESERENLAFVRSTDNVHLVVNEHDDDDEGRCENVLTQIHIHVRLGIKMNGGAENTCDRCGTFPRRRGNGRSEQKGGMTKKNTKIVWRNKRN